MPRTYTDLTAEEKQLALDVAKAHIAAEVARRIRGFERDTMPTWMGEVCTRTDSAAQTLAEGRSYSSAEEQEAVDL